MYGAIVLLAGTDVVTDLAGGTTTGHVLLESLVVLAGVLGLALGLRRVAVLRRNEAVLREQALQLGTRLAATRAEAARWREESRELVAGLGAAIERQFTRWGLSPAERDVATLLLKGFSHKEIARLRGVGEGTVRQQARSLYRKAGVDGRHDLAAFFLEELLPEAAAPPAEAPS